jgi:copper chaperone NosL
MTARTRSRIVAVLALAFLAAACSSGPRAIQLGDEECAHCRMVIGDEHYAAQLTTERGRSYAFDDVACMAAFIAAADSDTYRGQWVADFDNPGEWLPVEDAVFLKSPSLRTPMGGGASAHRSEEAARALLAEAGGATMNWNALLASTRTADTHGHDGH